MAAAEKKYRKKKLGSYPFVSVVFSISITLFVLGVFGYLMINATQITKTIRESVQLQVYLRKNVSESEMLRFNKTLSAKEYVLIKDGQPKVETISKEQAAEEYKQELGEDFVEFLGENPLRDVIILNIQSDYHHPDSLQKIKTEISKSTGVFEVDYQQNMVKQINDNLKVISATLLGFALILLLAALILINNTIKLALFSQRFLIRSMQLVGATSGFIQGPFLRRAVLYGFFSAIIASGVLYSIIIYLNNELPDLQALQSNQSLLILFASIIVLGMLVGFGSSYRAVNKYLKMSLDELY
ncbi:MAG: permease-like cell division protein FtsX [bacterium]|nr:permease-like cell division protein FtsX [bacterium]